MKQFYAYIEDNNGNKLDISSKIFFAHNQEYDCHSSIVITEHNFEGKLFTNVSNIICYGNKLSQIEAPKAIFIDCSYNLLERVEAPNCRIIWCQNNKSLSKERIIVHSECAIEADFSLNKYGYYAYVENKKGLVKELEIDKMGKLNCEYLDLEGELHTNAKEIVCNNNFLSKIFASDAEKVCCDDNFVVYINAPNCVEISYKNNFFLEKNNMILSPNYQEKNQAKQYKR